MFSSLISSLFNKSIEDEKFGTLIFSKLTKDAWRGKAYFEPTGNEIDIYIFDLEDKVSNIHKVFYQELELRYSTIIDKIADLLHKEYIAAGGNILRQDVWKKFKLAGITFPFVKTFNEGSFEWDMYYSYAPKMDNFLIEMKEWSPEECSAGESPIS
jgi:hypothetical protein